MVLSFHLIINNKKNINILARKNNEKKYKNKNDAVIQADLLNVFISQ